MILPLNVIMTKWRGKGIIIPFMIFGILFTVGMLLSNVVEP
ncbi:MAG: hypothetical protein OSA03_05825 [Nitrosopumilus sp.]|nr:hypothetical protein [Nitrosopumilus sp.]